MTASRFYTGIGSRATAADVCELMVALGEALAGAGWTLRSGGAAGADAAFEQGADRGGGAKEIYLPVAGYNGNASPLCDPPAAAAEIAGRLHPFWRRCRPAAKRLHSRNVLQVLGADLATPSRLVVVWTPG